MKAGDIVFFHPYLFHGSGENRVYLIINISQVVLENLFAAILLQPIVNIMILRVHSMKIWQMIFWHMLQRNLVMLLIT